MAKQLMIYGAYGYTGELCARFARDYDLSPLVAGRNAERVAQVGDHYGWEHRVLSLDDPEALKRGLDGVDVVLNCAGPFSRTADPMVRACIATRTHYLDVTGEIDVFVQSHSRSGEAREAGVLLMPGVGFDVVPSDCLAKYLSLALPDADRLTLAFDAQGAYSHGTATTMVENMGRGSSVRRRGEIVPIRLGSLTKKIDYGQGPKASVAIPWGDVATAYYSTGIPNVEVYIRGTAATSGAAKVVGLLPGVFGSEPVQKFLKARLDAGLTGPTDAERAENQMLLYGEVQNQAGRRFAARCRTPDGYSFTVWSALTIARRVLSGTAPAGFHTPSQVFGSDFPLECDGVSRQDL